MNDGSSGLKEFFETREIDEIELEGGGLKLSVRGRPQASGTSMPSAKLRESARVITMAWGDRYVNDLLSVTIPALLAPGNIPALAEYFQPELVIVTETRFFPTISCAPVIGALLKHCDLRLLPIDDLLSSWYGVTLTYALVRGFADLGAEMVNTHLIFLNADFILADGSYRRLAEVISAGARLVVAPSYCVALEQGLPQLIGNFDPATQTLPVSHREMARIILYYRHNCIRAKTVNQPLFHIGLYDQFYWYVNEQTLLGRQMPIALIYMQPERVLTELPTFWDYGVIAEYCPTSKPVVLGDSDDFLMAELRTESTYRDRIQLGWPQVEAIAEHLSSYVTADHHVYGRYDLVLHSGELPENVESQKAKLREFVDGVYKHLKPPLDYLNHPFWTLAWPYFNAARAEQTPKLHAIARIGKELREDPAFRRRRSEFEHMRTRARSIAARAAASQAERKRREAESAAVTRAKYDAELADLRTELEVLRTEFAVVAEADHGKEYPLPRAPNLKAESEDTAREEAARSTIVNEYLLDPLRNDINELERVLGGPLAEPERRIKEGPTSREPVVHKAAPSPPGANPLARIYRALFGRVPATTEWHPHHTTLQPFKKAFDKCPRSGSLLLLSSGGPFGQHLVRDSGRRIVEVTASALTAGLYDSYLRTYDTFPLCVCDVPLSDVARFRETFNKLQPFLQRGAKIIVFCYNEALQPLGGMGEQFVKGAFPLVGTSQITFAGSRESALALRWYSRITRTTRLTSIKGLMLAGPAMMIAAPLARLASWREGKRDNARAVPAPCTSFVIEIDLD